MVRLYPFYAPGLILERAGVPVGGLRGRQRRRLRVAIGVGRCDTCRFYFTPILAFCNSCRRNAQLDTQRLVAAYGAALRGAGMP